MEVALVRLPDLLVGDHAERGEGLQRHPVAQAGPRRVVDEPVTGGEPGESVPFAVTELGDAEPGAAPDVVAAHHPEPVVHAGTSAVRAAASSRVRSSFSPLAM